MTYHDYIKSLKNRGYKYFGEGAYAHVYGKEKSNRVVKVGHSIDGWVLFAYILLNNKRLAKSDIFPKIYSLKIFTNGHSEREIWWYVAEIERLDRTIRDVEDQYQEHNEDLYNFYDQVKYRSYWNQRKLRKYYSKADKCTKKSIDSLLKLKTLSQKYKPSWDLHDGNWMIRKNGTLVLTDPFEIATIPKLNKYIVKKRAA